MTDDQALHDWRFLLDIFYHLGRLDHPLYRALAHDDYPREYGLLAIESVLRPASGGPRPHPAPAPPPAEALSNQALYVSPPPHLPSCHSANHAEPSESRFRDQENPRRVKATRRWYDMPGRTGISHTQAVRNLWRTASTVGTI